MIIGMNPQHGRRYLSDIRDPQPMQLAGLGDVSSDIAALVAKGPGLLSQVVTIIDKAGEYLPVVMDIVEDPALPQIAQRIATLKDLAAGQPEGTTSTTNYVPGTGVGLSRAIPLLDGVIFFEKNPWTVYAGAAAVVALLGGIGYMLGRRSVGAKTLSGPTTRKRR